MLVASGLRPIGEVNVDPQDALSTAPLSPQDELRCTLSHEMQYCVHFFLLGYPGARFSSLSPASKPNPRAEKSDVRQRHRLGPAEADDPGAVRRVALQRRQSASGVHPLPDPEQERGAHQGSTEPHAVYRYNVR